jgi:hypothetical protein
VKKRQRDSIYAIQMHMCFPWASQALLKNSRYTQPYGTCLCYKVSLQVQGASNCTYGVRHCKKCCVFGATYPKEHCHLLCHHHISTVRHEAEEVRQAHRPALKVPGARLTATHHLQWAPVLLWGVWRDGGHRFTTGVPRQSPCGLQCEYGEVQHAQGMCLHARPCGR